MMNYPYEYFCGANVVVYLSDFPLLEASGFSYSIRESKRPIYGYSSRHFDAVARGQVLVEGTLVINYVHQDYLFYAASLAAGQDPATLKQPTVEGPLPSTFTDSSGKTASQIVGTSGGIVDPDTIARLEDTAGWNKQASDLSSSIFSGLSSTNNLHDGGGFEIRVSFGNPTAYTPNGHTGLVLRRVHFTGRAKTIQIDAETIVEAYSFLARDVTSTLNPPQPSLQLSSAAADQ
jgi:hypothetical protein